MEPALSEANVSFRPKGEISEAFACLVSCLVSSVMQFEHSHAQAWECNAGGKMPPLRAVTLFSGRGGILPPAPRLGYFPMNFSEIMKRD